jgi:hypothetical protein
MNKLPTFELLPNEILIECFEYLNAFEIFYSFNRLNYRFYKLIRTIPLYLNFQYVQKIIFDQFCLTIKSNPELKKQIYSLKLSNKDTCGQIEIFLSFFSLNEFSHLRSLTLVQIEKNNVDKLKTMLPLMFQLNSFRLIRFFDFKNEENELLSILPMSNLRILSIPTLQSILIHIDKTSIITHLTVSSCSLDQLLCQLFKYAPLLKYLNIQNIYKTSHSIKNSDWHNAIHLKQIIIDSFEYLFDEFEIFIKSIPNLKSLTISALDNICMIDAYQWEYLIKSSLPYLKIFQFTFGLYCRGKVRNDIVEKFKQFQNDFWCKQHQWFIEYVLDTNSAVIYTVPYTSNTYRLTLCSNKLINNFHTFDNVTDLTLCYEATREKCVYYFSNVVSLKLETTFVGSKQNDNHILRIEYIKSITMIINFYNLKHLDISSYFAIETSSLLEIFKQTSQLSSITINPFILSTLFDDEELCNYLNKMIKKMNIYKFGHDSFNNSNEVEQFCEIFSNIEQLICNINHIDQLAILLNQSPKLSSITVFLTPSDNSEKLFSWFKTEALKFNIIYRINYFHTYADGPRELYKTELCIWTGGRSFN